eukprot:5232430-Amphidinium_carterae.4
MINELSSQGRPEAMLLATPTGLVVTLKPVGRVRLGWPVWSWVEMLAMWMNIILNISRYAFEALMWNWAHHQRRATWSILQEALRARPCLLSKFDVCDVEVAVETLKRTFMSMKKPSAGAHERPEGKGGIRDRPSLDSSRVVRGQFAL